MEIKQNQKFLHGICSNLTSFLLVPKYLNSLLTFIIGNFQFYCQSEHKQVKRNKITPEMSKCDSNFPYLQSSALFKWVLEFISW